MARKNSSSDDGGRTTGARGDARSLLFLVAVPLLTVSLVVGAVVVAATTQGERAASRAVNEDLGATQAVQTAFQQQRYQRLNLISRLFATDQLLNTYLAEAAEDRERTAIQASIEEYQNLLTFDLGIVLDQSGTVLARTDGDDGVGENLAATPLVSAALQDQNSSGVWREGGGVYHAVAVPLVREFELVGYTVVAYAVNNALASQVKRSGGADAVYFAAGPTGPEVMASTLAGDRSQLLVTAIRRDGGDAFDRVLNRGETVSAVPIGLGDEEWTVSLSPLRDAVGDPVGAVAALRKVGSSRLGYRLVMLVAGAAGLGAAILAGLLLVVWHRRSGGPAGELADAAEAAEGGRLDVEIPAARGELGRLGAALRGILGRMREKGALEAAYAHAAGDERPTRRDDAGAEEAHTAEGAVLGIDLRRYAHPKLGYDPVANCERLAADVERIGRCAERCGGRLASVAGHRVLAVFEGEGHALRALEAASSVALSLAADDDGGDAADAPEPALALNVGSLVIGSVELGSVGQGGHGGGGQRVTSVAGLPVQLLDALLREAQPGAIYFSKPVWGVLGQTLHDAGVEVKAQRPVLSTQPLYFVAPRAAAELTGARTLDRAAADDAEALGDDLAAGRTLGSRFRLLDELRRDPLGPVFLSDDEQMGQVVRLRLLRADAVRDSTRFERLKQVVSRCRVLRHPNALGVFDFGEVARTPFVSMEWAQGVVLAEILERSGEELAAPAVLRLVRQIAWGVAAAHGHQVMHGALAPGNVLVQADGTARVMDFGLARVAGLLVDPGAESEFLAPEQLLGEEDDSRVDFWSLGAIAYRLLTGRPPLEGDDPASLRASAETVRSAGGPRDLAEVAPQVARELPPEFLEVLRRCLKADADERYPTADQLLRALESVRL